MSAARLGGQVPLVLAATFLAFLGQMTLTPIIAPLSREVGLAEWQVGLTISLAALMVVLTSQFWGSRSQSWGRKPVLLAALGTATAAMALFAGLAQLGMRGIVTGALLFALFLLLRGVAFGAAIAAVAPTAQAYIANVTETPEERVRGMAGVGAVQGMAMIAGSVLGGLLAGFGILVALIAVPACLALALLLVLARLRPEPAAELVERPTRVSPRDPRVWPFLVAGFGLFTALGCIQVITGFLVQDRFGLDARMTGMVTGGALLAAGVGMVLAQSVLVPRLRVPPAALLRIGAPVAAVGFLALLPARGPFLLVFALFLIGAGLGVAMPGYAAGPSLLVSPEEQGGLAGLLGANNGLTFVIAPTAGTALYALWPPLPVLVSTAVMLVVVGFVTLHPALRRRPGERPGR